MKAFEAEQQFAESKRLFAEGQFDKALAVLMRLDAEHPNDRHLLYPLALCLARVGRVNEARNVCDRLVREFGDERAAALARQLAVPAPTAPPAAPGTSGQGVPGLGIPGLGIPGLQPIDLGDLNAPVVKYTPPPKDPAWKTWLTYGGVVLGTLAVIVLVTFVVLSASSQSGGSGQEGANSISLAEKLANMGNEPPPTNPVFWLVLVVGFFFYPSVLYGVVAYADKLPYEETWRNIGHVALVTFGLAAFDYVLRNFLGCIAFPITFIVSIVLVKRAYWLETGHAILWYVAAILYGVVFGIVLVLSWIAFSPPPRPITGTDPAPALSVANWMKGEPVRLEDGKGKNIYVVEFWATWCPPCRESIPHLTELQKKYKDSGVIVVGVTDEDEATVASFLLEMGDKMDYRVALDNNRQTHDAYEAISPIPGIPTAFVVDKNGNVVWKGHPMDNLDQILDGLT